MAIEHLQPAPRAWENRDSLVPPRRKKSAITRKAGGSSESFNYSDEEIT